MHLQSNKVVNYKEVLCIVHHEWKKDWHVTTIVQIYLFMFHSMLLNCIKKPKMEMFPLPTGEELHFAHMIHKCNFVWPHAKITNCVLLVPI